MKAFAGGLAAVLLAGAAAAHPSAPTRQPGPAGPATPGLATPDPAAPTAGAANSVSPESVPPVSPPLAGTPGDAAPGIANPALTQRDGTWYNGNRRATQSEITDYQRQQTGTRPQ